MADINIDLPMFCEYRRDGKRYYCNGPGRCESNTEYPEHCPKTVKT